MNKLSWRGWLAATTILASMGVGADASAFIASSVGGHEGEIDINAHFIGEFGKVEPTERPSTWQKANVKILTGGAGYTIGDIGCETAKPGPPDCLLKDVYVRLEGAYYNAASEQVEQANDHLPVGHQFFSADRGGYITATVATNLVHESRFAFGVFLQGTMPIDVNFQKFSSVHLHYVGGGTTLGVFLTKPGNLIRLAFASRLFVGSGAYKDGFQHNASFAMTNLFVVQAKRWLLPWRMGISFGPYFEGDLNEHVNQVYNDAYKNVKDVGAALVDGDRIRAMRFAIAILPYFRITQHAAIELGYVQKLFGYDPPATQFWTGGVRATF